MLLSEVKIKWVPNGGPMENGQHGLWEGIIAFHLWRWEVGKRIWNVTTRLPSSKSDNMGNHPLIGKWKTKEKAIEGAERYLANWMVDMGLRPGKAIKRRVRKKKIIKRRKK